MNNGRVHTQMNSVYEKIKNCYTQIRERTGFKPAIGLVLGSGLGSLGDEAEIIESISYCDIKGFPHSTVPGHEGRFIFGYINSVPVVIMQGRVHYYEGYDITDVVLPIRIMGMLGIKALLLTNAAGGINPEFSSGVLMLIRDHISSLVPSPLRGENIDELGARFPDMSTVYNPQLCETVRNTAGELGIDLKEGVYLQTPGPNYETPAEIRMYGCCGADAVGMSTACEATAANHMGIKTCAVSYITNMAAGLSSAPLTHKEVGETAARVSKEFKALIRMSVVNIYKQL